MASDETIKINLDAGSSNLPDDPSSVDDLTSSLFSQDDPEPQFSKRTQRKRDRRQRRKQRRQERRDQIPFDSVDYDDGDYTLAPEDDPAPVTASPSDSIPFDSGDEYQLAPDGDVTIENAEIVVDGPLDIDDITPQPAFGEAPHAIVTGKHWD